MPKSATGSNSEPQYEIECPHCGERIRIGRDAVLIPVEVPQTAASDDGLEDRFREEIVERILAKRFEIPLLPHVALRVIQLTGDTKTSMQDLAKVILTDQGIASRVLQIANSAVYAGAAETTTVSQALVRLGQNEVKNLMLAISMQTKVFHSVVYKTLAQSLWEHSVAVAFAARVAANALRLPKEEAFLSGLMHDVGKMVLLRIMEESQRKIGPNFRPADETVREIMGRYGTDVSEMAAKAWDLPDHLTECLTQSSRLDSLESPAPEAVAVALANDIVVRRGVGPDHEADLLLHETHAARFFKLNEDACAELDRRFEQLYEKARGVFV